MTARARRAELEERIRGFQDYVADYPGIEIVTTVACNDDINLGVRSLKRRCRAIRNWMAGSSSAVGGLRGEGAMPLFESAVRDNGLKAIAFDTLPVELEWVTVGLLHGLVGQKYWGWGYDTVHMLYEHTLFATPYESGLTPAWTS